MEKRNWIPLTQYSSKYGVSVSTLRRRIKTQKIEFTYGDGKYLLLDMPLSHQRKSKALSDPKKAVDRPLDRHKKGVDRPLSIQEEVRPYLNTQKEAVEMSLSIQEEDTRAWSRQEKSISLNCQEENMNMAAVVAPPQSQSDRCPEESVFAGALSDKDILATTNRLLDELKKAYSLILQEKEEQVILIRDEVADLKTLVCVLEDENRRLREQQKKLKHSSSLLGNTL